jgi:hypothetical protein
MMRGRTFCVVMMALLLAASPALARDVAFVEPGSGGSNATPDEAFKIEPKSEIDIGDSILNIVRRETLFYVNQTSAPIKIEKVTLSSDSTVTPTIVNDDCSKEAIVPPLSRCSIELSIMPIGPGSWSVELLMTHDGPGRITRAKINGKTAGSSADEKKDRGLSLSAKDAKPIEFGEVTAGDGKVVRSALMVNDSASPITLYSIDVIEADKSLQRLDTGCTADMDLKPGESCPVTLVWTPTARGLISTDLIIRHSGQLGFAVIPVRGVAKGSDKDGGSASDAPHSASGNHNDNSTPPPPSANEVAKEVARAVGGSSSHMDSSFSAATGSVHLIGTVGNRAVLLKPDGSTAIVQVGDQVDLGDSAPAKVVSVSGTAATLMIGSKKKELMLEAVQQLKDRAAASKKNDTSGGHDVAGNGGKENPGGGLGFSTPSGRTQ